MKQIITFITLFLICNLVIAQDTETVTFNTLTNTGEFQRLTYKHPTFIKGKVVFTDNAVEQAMMNYILLNDQILFLNPKGDTLILGNTGVNRVELGQDTLYFHEEGIVQMIASYSSANLAVKKVISLAGIARKGAFGGYSNVSSDRSVALNFSNNRQIQFGVDENYTYNVNSLYFISDKSNKYMPATKKNLYSLFPKQAKELKAFVDSNKLNFEKKADLKKALTYTQTLK